MNRMRWLLVAVLGGSALALGCGDDDSDTPTDTPAGDMSTDSGTTSACPPAPDPADLMGECGYRVSNADRLDSPEFRLVRLEILSEGSPPSLSNDLVNGLLATGLEDETFNWLISAQIDGNMATVLTGYGERNDDNTYTFAADSAPGPGPSSRWNPVMVTGTLEGTTLTAPPVMGSFSVPVFDDDCETLTAELPLMSFEILSVEFSEDRSCVGAREGMGAAGGMVQTFITVEAAKQAEIRFGTILNTSLCNMIRGSADAGFEDCETTPVTDWMYPPNAACADEVCSDTCTGAECNAWKITSAFSAAGVEII